MFETLLVSTGIVALAEIGDKTQLLALLLAARYRKPIPIIAGILIATLANHFLAASLGHQIAQLLSESTLLWLLAASFLAVAAWTLVPDKLDDDGQIAVKHGPFIATVIAFFIAEMGDKTQVATVMLAAQFEYFWMVIGGTTIGMLLANAPVVLVGNFAAERLPLKLIRTLAATGFLAFALYCAWQAFSL
ncbi:TMEM165/GDT1 family protein [Denitrificimonas caeni]|uniref:TMEM165/GDT1 family protein n=1 Tax=Denitrificimonas caeni TaxID=521720 RepID=UPI0019655541|nr:TMEM165/GDT1 family protein [Denitrificimonas caeni]